MLYARTTRMPGNLEGNMRLAQSTVEVQVVGDDKVRQFNVPPTEQPKKQSFWARLTGKRDDVVTVSAAAYMIVHEADMSALITNTQVLSAGMLDPVAGPRLRELRSQFTQSTGPPK